VCGVRSPSTADVIEIVTINSILGLTNANSVGRALSPGKTETAIEIYGFMVNK